MNFVLDLFKIYIHMIFIMIYLQFSQFPYFFVTVSTLCIMQEKKYTFIITIYRDSVES